MFGSARNKPPACGFKPNGTKLRMRGAEALRFHSGNAGFVACFACVLLAVIATASVKSQDLNLSQLTESELDTLVIQFERSSCYGNCPAYRLTIHGDGRIEYNGIRFVKQIGPAQGQWPERN